MLRLLFLSAKDMVAKFLNLSVTPDLCTSLLFWGSADSTASTATISSTVSDSKVRQAMFHMLLDIPELHASALTWLAASIPALDWSSSHVSEFFGVLKK